MTINTEELLKNCANNERIVLRLIEIFVDQAPIWVDELDAAFRSANVEEVRMLCHRIKGGAGTVQAFEIRDAASTLGEQVKSGKIDTSDELFKHLVTLINEDIDLAQQLLAASKD